MNFGSVFTGIGGFDLGFERAGLKGAWQIEIDKDCNRVLDRHWPQTRRHADVRKTRKLAPTDVICGGFPCQDLSVAGKRAGLVGERSGLWFEFLRIVERDQPRFVVGENVPGLLSSDDGRDFAIIVSGLVKCGYCVAWRVFDAQYFGVAQRRRRVFFVGSLGNGSCAKILFESEGVPGNPPSRREAGAGIIPILETGARTNGDGYQDGDGIGIEDDPMFTLQAGEQHAVGLPDVAWALQERDAAAGESDVVAFGWNKSESQTMRISGESCQALQSSPTSNPAVAMVAPTLSAESYSPTKSSSGQQIDWAIGTTFGVRRLTPRECERLQGFPDDWTRYDAAGKEISDSARYRMLGNAVAVPVAEWIGQRLALFAER